MKPRLPKRGKKKVFYSPSFSTLFYFPFLQLSETYRNSLVGDSFDRIEIEAFQQGSVFVDYYVYFKELDPGVKTSDLKDVLNQQLDASGDVASDEEGMVKLGRYTVDPSYTDFEGKGFIARSVGT